MAEELQRADSNLKPSELKAAFKRSRDIDALLDEERELKEKEVQLLILGKAWQRSRNSTVATRHGLLLGRGIYTNKYFIVYFEYCLTVPCNRSLRLLHRKRRAHRYLPKTYSIPGDNQSSLGQQL